MLNSNRRRHFDDEFNRAVYLVGFGLLAIGILYAVVPLIVQALSR